MPDHIIVLSQSALLFGNGSNATYSDVASLILDLSNATSISSEQLGLFPSDINTTNHVVSDIIDFLISSAESGELLPFNSVSV